jgi:hypothetical protein
MSPEVRIIVLMLHQLQYRPLSGEHPQESASPLLCLSSRHPGDWHSLDLV